MSESIKSLRAILAKSARTDAAREKKGGEKQKSNRVELQYPKIMVPLPKIGVCAGVQKSEGRVVRGREMRGWWRGRDRERRFRFGVRVRSDGEVYFRFEL